MICSACGNPLSPDARFCPRCGGQTLFQPQPGSPYPQPPMPYDRVSRNIQGLGILWLVYAALRIFSGVFGVLILHGLFGHHFGNSDFNLGWSPFGSMWLAQPLAHGPVFTADRRLLHPFDWVCVADASTLGTHIRNHLWHPRADSLAARNSPRDLHALGARTRCQRRRVCGAHRCAA